MPKKIKLPNGKYTVVDDEDYERIKNCNWRLQPEGHVACHKTYYLHREILQVTDDRIVDHKNGDRLDNRKENLRIATPTQNCVNKGKGKRNKHSILYKGIKYRLGLKKPWIARIGYEGKTKHIGYFATEKEAAMNYDIWAKKLYGEFARLNFLYDATK